MIEIDFLYWIINKAATSLRFLLFGVVGRNIWLLLSECFGETLDCNPFGSKSGKFTVACYK